MKQKKIALWRDFPFFIFAEFSLLVFWIILFVLVGQGANSLEKGIFFLLLFYLLGYFFITLLKSNSKLYSDFIFIGGIVGLSGKRKIISLPQRVNLTDINEISLIRKGHFSGMGGRYFYHLIIREKNGKIIESVINKPKSFISALKKLNKLHLLDKKSRERFAK